MNLLVPSALKLWKREPMCNDTYEHILQKNLFHVIFVINIFLWNIIEIDMNLGIIYEVKINTDFGNIFIYRVSLLRLVNMNMLVHSALKSWKIKRICEDTLEHILEKNRFFVIFVIIIFVQNHKEIGMKEAIKINFNKYWFWKYIHLQSEPITIGPYEFVCPFCYKTMKTYRDMQHHIRSHSSEKPYACSICQKQFLWKKSRDTHEQSIHKVYRKTCKL